MYKKKLALMCAAISLAATASMSAQANTSYGDIVSPGVYFGTGNNNGDFTVNTQGGVELALRAKNYGGATIDGKSGIYEVAPGVSPLKATRASWNYEFSVDTAASKSGLGAYSFLLGVDHDATAGTNFTFVNPLALWNDNKFVTDALLGQYGFQNSENVIFGDTPGGPFDLSAPGLYSFVLQAFDANRLLVSQVDTVIRVGPAAVPEPATIALLGLGLFGFAASRRKSAKIKAA